MDTKRIAGLDGLRAIAAMAVVFHHVGFQSGATFGGFWGRYLGRLDIGVPVFFVLSGFLLFTPIAAAILDERPLRNTIEYLWRRAMRIYPAFWVALAVIVLFTSESLGFGGFVTTTLLAHIYWPDFALGPIPQAWSLATEISFYLLLPFVARLLRAWLKHRHRDERFTLLLMFVASCYLLSVFFKVAVLSWQNRLGNVAVLWLPAMLDYFAIGMFLAVMRVGYKPKSAERARLSRIASKGGWWWATAALLFHVVAQHLGLALGLDVASWPREIGRQIVYGMIGFALLFPLTFSDSDASWVQRFTASKPLAYLGKISFSVYLWHMVFIAHPLGFMTNIFGDVVQFEANFVRLFLIAVPPTLLAAVASYHLVERGGQQLQNWVRRPVSVTSKPDNLLSCVAARWRSASFRLQLVLVAGLGLLFRVLYVVVVKRDHSLASEYISAGDQFYYSLAADALVDGKGFVTPWHEIIGEVPLNPAADHPPLTAIVAALGSLLSPSHTAHLLAQRLVMCVVGAGVIVMVGLLGRRLAGRSVGLIAAGVAAAYPPLWINDGLVMAESLTALCVAGALWSALRYRDEPRLWRGAQVGAWVGLAALARSESLLLVVLLLVPLMLVTHASWRTRAKATLVSCVAVMLVVSPWVLPNLVRFDEPVLMSTNDGLTLIGANSPQTYSGSAIGFWTLEYANSLDHPELQDGDPSVRARIFRTEAFSYFSENLSRLPQVVAARLGLLWSVFRPLQMSELNTGEGREVWASNLALVGFWVAAPLALFGWWCLGSARAVRWPLAALVAHVCLIGILFYGVPRFRVPAEIAVVVCAAVAIHRISTRGTKKLQQT